MPWLTLPFKDPNNKKLKRILGYPYMNGSDPERDPELDPRIVIFGPHGKFIEPHGSQIMCEFGISAYSFTHMKLAKLEMEKVKELTLWDRNTVFRRNDGSQVLFSELSGKRVVLFIEGIRDFKYPDWSLNTKFLKMLKERYLESKGTDDEFEVIYILENKDDLMPGDKSLVKSAAKHIGVWRYALAGII